MADVPTMTVTLEGLTKDELMLLVYAIPNDRQWGDPFKDIYEFERDCKHRVDDVTASLKSLNQKIIKPLMSAIDALPSNGNKDEDE